MDRENVGGGFGGEGEKGIGDVCARVRRGANAVGEECGDGGVVLREEGEEHGGRAGGDIIECIECEWSQKSG